MNASANACVLAPPAAPEHLRLARRQWLETGTVAEGLIAPALHERWVRSRRHGLSPDGRAPGAPHASSAQLARALDHRHALVSHAKPVMAFLNEQISDSDSLVVLADPQGMLLHSLGDLGFADRAARVALRPGAIWSEQWRGTNAIGTALAEEAAVVVRGAEHYLQRNGFLSCAAAPIADASGQLLGVLDISGDRRGYHRHTLGLVRSGARMIEHQLFEARHAGGLKLRLHALAAGLGSFTEGLVALSEDGWIVGATTAALELLGLPRSAIGTTTIDRVLAVDLGTLLGGRGPALRGPHALR
ncbi:MAG: GAF domain-containing protein, partial [Burkholderiales bacterium]|nr:GAF domain-containing protein [Burkholderiales bacterium]